MKVRDISFSFNSPNVLTVLFMSPTAVFGESKITFS